MAVAGYGALSEVYEWLMPEGKLTPAGSVAAFGDLVERLPPEARVLDCACGTGQLAVGLAALGLDVTATDASAAMVHRTQQLAEQHGVSLRTLRVSWDELSDCLDGTPPFDVVFCVGNSLAHAEGASARFDALSAMSRLLSREGRLVLTSRTWELVRARGSRLDVGHRLVRRQGRDAVVVYNWQIEQRWEEEHHLEIAVAQVASDGSVRTCSERLSCWPFRQEELVSQLQAVGLGVESNTFDPDAENYTVVAVKGEVPEADQKNRH